MNDEKIENLMQSYSDSIGVCSRKPVSRSRSVRGRLAFAGAAMATVFGVTFLLWPKDAAAQAMERMGRAINDAKSMEMIYEVVKPDYRKGRFSRYMYEDSKWRLHVAFGKPIEQVMVFNHGKVLTEASLLDYATVEPYDSESHMGFVDGEVDALEFAKETLESGAQIGDRVATITDNPDGKTQTLVLERNASGYRAEILVDKATNLPISATMKVGHEFADGLEVNEYRQTYRFNQDIPDSIFEIASKKRIVDIPALKKSFAKRWITPLAVVDSTDVRDAGVTPDGTIWIVTSSKPGLGHQIPSSVDAGNGVRYARTREIGVFVPSVAESEGGPRKPEFEIDGKVATLHCFTPTIPTTAQPSWINLKMAPRIAAKLNYDDLIEKPTKESAAQTIAVRKELGATPESYPIFVRGFSGIMQSTDLLVVRAVAFESDKNWEQAGRAFESHAIAFGKLFHLSGAQSLKDAARCYRKAGLSNEAHRVSEEAKSIALARRGDR